MDRWSPKMWTKVAWPEADWADAIVVACGHGPLEQFGELIDIWVMQSSPQNRADFGWFGMLFSIFFPSCCSFSHVFLMMIRRRSTQCHTWGQRPCWETETQADFRCENKKPGSHFPSVVQTNASVHGVSRIMEGSASSLQELEKKFGNLGDGARQPSRCHEVPLMAAPKSQLNGWVATGFGSSWKTFASAILWPAPCPVLAQ